MNLINFIFADPTRQQLGPIDGDGQQLSNSRREIRPSAHENFGSSSRFNPKFPILAVPCRDGKDSDRLAIKMIRGSSYSESFSSWQRSEAFPLNYLRMKTMSRLDYLEWNVLVP